MHSIARPMMTEMRTGTVRIIEVESFDPLLFGSPAGAGKRQIAIGLMKMTIRRNVAMDMKAWT